MTTPACAAFRNDSRPCPKQWPVANDDGLAHADAKTTYGSHKRQHPAVSEMINLSTVIANQWTDD